MIKLSACIEMLFREYPFEERFAAARACGLEAVEFWGWENKDVLAVKEQLDKTGLALAAFCVGSHDPAVSAEWNAKKLSDRSGIPAFLAALRDTAGISDILGCRTLITTCGQSRDDILHTEQHTNIVLALRAAVPFLEENGLILALEPLNIICDHRGYFLPSSYEAFSIAEEVGSKNVKVLYDVYHQQISEGNIIPTIRKNIGLIGHFHTADVPGRHQPGTGELNYRNIFAAIDAAGYTGYVGMEFGATGSTADAVKETMAFK